MKGLFSFDGPLYKSCVLIYETFMLNLLWFIGSIPIVTIGISTSALYYVYGKKVTGKSYKIYSDFFKGYKDNFKQALCIGTVITVILLLSFYNLIELSSFGQKYIWLLGLQVFIIFQILLISVFIFPLISRLDMKIIDIVHNSVVLAYKHLGMSILCVLILMALISLVYFMRSYILFFASSYVLITSYIVERILKKHIKTEAD